MAIVTAPDVTAPRTHFFVNSARAYDCSQGYHRLWLQECRGRQAGLGAERTSERVSRCDGLSFSVSWSQPTLYRRVWGKWGAQTELSAQSIIFASGLGGIGCQPPAAS